MDWEYKIAGLIIFGVIGVIISFVLLIIVINRFIYLNNKKQEYRIREEAKKRRCWLVSQEEFDEILQVATNLHSLVSYEIAIGKTDRIIKILKGEKEHNNDQA